MNAYAMFATDEALRVSGQRLADLRRESRNHRLVAGNAGQPSIAGAIGAALASVRSAFAPVETQAPAVPALTDYPYRS